VEGNGAHVVIVGSSSFLKI